MRIVITFTAFVFLTSNLTSQCVKGIIYGDNNPVKEALVYIKGSVLDTKSDSSGKFNLCISSKISPNSIIIKKDGFEEIQLKIKLKNDTLDLGIIDLTPVHKSLNEVIITGSLKEIDRKESPVNVEVYTPKFFNKNPTPNFFESLQIVNGVRPQINCNVCNTGDIHINGMEGPYTMVTIDGMPIVSGLSSVYGLIGIPNAIVDRIEIVKGPASTLYGSEAMGGLINIITKNPLHTPLLSINSMATSYNDIQLEGAIKMGNDKFSTLLSLDYYSLTTKWDLNKDNFTDVTLQNRISIFNKWGFNRKKYRIANIAARYIYENRWGGEMNWDDSWRGSDSLYGESIYTHRAEVIGNYQLPINERVVFQFSYNFHHQDSYYGNVPYFAIQHVAFTQMYWDKPIGKKHNLLYGITYRYNYYDDNSPATQSSDSINSSNQPQHIHLPGTFLQYEWKISPKHYLLAGLRYDYSFVHGSIFSPRFNYKWAPHKNHALRFSFGNGYRVVNLFTEDHAALSGSRDVIILETLKPEISYNGNINYVGSILHKHGFVNIDVTGFYTYFTNKITGDYFTHPDKIIYKNLNGYAVSTGVSFNLDISFLFGLRLHSGITYMQVFQVENDSMGNSTKFNQLFAPTLSGTFALTYTFPNGKWEIDITGQWNGPMRLPVLPNDYRPEYSLWYCLMNFQISKKWDNGLQLFTGIKNIFNFIPENPIMRPFDPFDKTADDPVNNPYGYTFDASYNYAPLQGIRGFLGVRYVLN